MKVIIQEKNYEENLIHVLYDFGNTLIILNKSSDMDGESTPLGAIFEEMNSVGSKGNEDCCEYEISEIVGVMFY